MTIPDPIAEIVDLLADAAAVAALAADRVYGGALPPAVTKTSSWPQPAVVVKPAGGPGRRGYELHRNTRVDTICFGATLLQSWQLHLAVREVLENLRRAGSIFWATANTDGANGLDPVEQWPTCYASYLVKSAVSQ